MKEGEVVTSSNKKKKESPGSADGEGRQQEDALDVPRGVPLLEGAEAETAQFQAESSVRNNTESDDLYYKAEEEMDTFILDILTKRPALDAAQRKRDQETASMTRDSWNDVIKQHQATTTQQPPKEEQTSMPGAASLVATAEYLNSAKEDLCQETPNTTGTTNHLRMHLLAADINEAAKMDLESREAEIMDIVADRANSAVSERLNAKEDLHNKGKPNTTDGNNVLQIGTEIQEAAKMGKIVAVNANTNDANAQKAALVMMEQQGSVPGNMVDSPAVVEAAPQPALHQTRTQMRPQSRPGAFLGAPGQHMQRNPNLNYGLVGANSGIDGDGPGRSSVGTAAQISTNQGLVQANAIEDDTAELVHANPVDLEATQQRTLQRKQQQKTFFAVVLWLLLVVAIVVGFVVSTQKNKDPDVVVLKSTEAPSVYGSMEPSDVPSSAPTGTLDLLLDSLPDYTLVSINKGSETPQWRAWNWLANHQNITHLPEWRKTQLFALATFFYAFEGDNWNSLIKGHGWMDDMVEECLWFSSGFGFFVAWDGTYHQHLSPESPCNDNGEYTTLFLQGLQLSGFSPFLPPEIALLTSLSLVDFWMNDIAGPLSSLLPTDLSEMTGLSHIDLGANQFSGQIPSELSQLTSLTQLELYGNRLTGQIPSELGLLTSLEVLWLFHNQLTGPWPSELGLLNSLTDLWLQENQLTGPVSSELWLLTSMKKLWLNDNQLTGPLPSELWLLTSLDMLSLDTNTFTGRIPSELGKLTDLTSLELNQNQLTGRVPSELGKLPGLTWLELDRNLLTGRVPSELGQLTLLQRLVLDDNQFCRSYSF